MELNLKTKLFCKYLALLLVSVTIHNSALAQKRPQQNIKRVTVTNRYVFENGKKTDEYWPVYQEMFDSLGRLHTEIEYDFADHYPHNYILHSFEGKQMVNSETYKDGNLQTIETITYSRDNLIAQKVYKKINQSDTSIVYILNFKYNIKRNPIEVSAKTAERKTAYVSKSTFDDKGKELTRNVRVSRNYYPQDSVLKLICVPVYDSLGRVISEHLTINKVGGYTLHKSFKYSYDKSNNQIGIIELDKNGKQIHREEKGYKPNRKISWVKYFDANDVLIRMIGIRYDIYPTNDTRFKEIEY